MEPELQVNPLDPRLQAETGGHKRKNIILISLIVFCLLLLAAAAQFTYMTLKNDKVYRGVYVNDLNVGGLSRSELETALNRQFQDSLKGKEIVLKTDHQNKSISFADLKVGYDVDSAVNKAYGAGRTGNIFDRLYDIAAAATGRFEVSMPLTYSKDAIEKAVNSFYEETLVPVKEADLLIQDDKITLRSGKHGENVDRNAIKANMEQDLEAGTGGTISAALTITPPSKLNVDELYEQITSQPKDAGFKVENGTVTVIPNVTGRKIDKATLANLAALMDKTEDSMRVLPVDIVKPELTTEMASSMMFRDIIGKMSTHFSVGTENDKNRGENIKLAASKIDGKLLAPGETFSFNETVGPRTADGGYQLAHTYTAGKVVDGIGGGICQVSTTLYNAVLKADLNVNERRNHIFTVAYAPFGQDATVSFGTTDFKFTNNTRWPIKLEASVSASNYITFTLLGTNETPDKKVLITNQTLKTTPFTIKYIDDPTLPEGKTVVKQEGKNGYVIDTFKTVKMGNEVVSQSKMYRSTYQPLVEEVLKGTKKVAAAGTQAKQGTQKPAEPAQSGQAAVVQPPAGTQATQPSNAGSGVDDADNPPAPPSE